jgi:hypothetical protein
MMVRRENGKVKQGGYRNERVQNITMHDGENSPRDWSWRIRNEAYSRSTRLGELDRSPTDLRALDGIMNDFCCLIDTSLMC